MPHDDDRVRIYRTGFEDGQRGRKPMHNGGVPYQRGYLQGTINRLWYTSPTQEQRNFLGRVERRVKDA